MCDDMLELFKLLVAGHRHSDSSWWIFWLQWRTTTLSGHRFRKPVVCCWKKSMTHSHNCHF